MTVQHLFEEPGPLSGLTYTEEERHLFALVTGFMRSKLLLAAIRLEIFDYLSVRPRSRDDLKEFLDFPDRSLKVFLDCLLQLRLVGINDKGRYLNTGISSKYLVKGKLSYIGGSFNLFDAVYGECRDLVPALREGKGENRTYSYLFGDRSLLRPLDVAEFTRQMDETSAHPVMTLTEFYDFDESKVVLDLGGGTGKICQTLVSQFPHLETILYDLPAVAEKAEEALEGFWLRHRIRVVAGDFFADPLPEGFDTAVLMRVTQDYGRDDVMALFRKVYQALPIGGKIIVYETFRDADRKKPGDAALISLLLLLNTVEGISRGTEEVGSMLEEAGFREVDSFQTIYVYSAVVGVRR